MKLSDELGWDDILHAVDEGRVVPIVGRELLIVDTDTGPQSFHHLVASQLAAKLGVVADTLPPGFQTNDVICANKDFRGDTSRVDAHVRRIIEALQASLKVPIPEPLQLLAEIPKFQLFVSATIDTLLEDAISKVRRRHPIVLTFPPEEESLRDFDESIHKNVSFVFKLMGGMSSSPLAVTDGQVLEQMHDFMAGSQRPVDLIAKLQRSHLLVLGVSFPDWLARFLLRLTRKNKLWDSRSQSETFVEGPALQQGFAQFLHHFSPVKSQILEDGSPVDFVRELHRQWFERHPATRNTALSDPEGRPEPMNSGSVFISYASEDREEAFCLANLLAARNLDVWVDRRINPGDEFRPLIERNIRECCAFVAVLSQHTQVGGERWFRREWKQACERNELNFGSNRRFLFPVVVDNSRSDELDEFSADTFKTSAVWALGGNPPDSLTTQLDYVQKSFRKKGPGA